MALNAYLELEGESQGEMHGSVQQAGREGRIMVIGVDHHIAMLQDDRGQFTGKRQHAPLVITKEVEASSPKLMAAMANHEKLTKFKLEFWQPSSSGQEMQFYTIELHDAYIADAHFEMLNNKVPENMRHAEREHIAFSYRQIVWTFMHGGITAIDRWE